MVIVIHYGEGSEDAVFLGGEMAQQISMHRKCTVKYYSSSKTLRFLWVDFIVVIVINSSADNKSNEVNRLAATLVPKRDLPSPFQKTFRYL